jgi:methyl-accepting chemotaxis protein
MNRWKLYNRRVLVDAFQLRLVTVSIVHFVLVVLVFASVLFLPLAITLQSDDLSSPAVREAAHAFLALHSRLWPPLLGAFVLLVLHIILVTHRVAGPLYRFRKFLKSSVGEGDLVTEIRIRRGDYLHKEADAINEMLAGLRDKISRLELQIDQTNELWTNLRVSLAGRVPEELEQRINALGEHLDRCRTDVSFFRTTEAPRSQRRVEGEVVVEAVEV